MKLIILDSHLKGEYLDKYAVGDTFIETGSWLGDNAELVRQSGRFVVIHSIEGDRERFDYCKERFEGKPSVVMWHGEGRAALRTVLGTLNKPATIWLDSPPGPGGHPILDELATIKEFPIKDHTIFIDDRRLFGSGEWGENVTEAAALKILREINPDYRITYLDGEVPEDIIVATTKE
jgi:hypothetical protein